MHVSIIIIKWSGRMGTSQNWSRFWLRCPIAYQVFEKFQIQAFWLAILPFRAEYKFHIFTFRMYPIIWFDIVHVHVHVHVILISYDAPFIEVRCNMLRSRLNRDNNNNNYKLKNWQIKIKTTHFSFHTAIYLSTNPSNSCGLKRRPYHSISGSTFHT